jgi:hypothetical protein
VNWAFHPVRPLDALGIRNILSVKFLKKLTRGTLVEYREKSSSVRRDKKTFPQAI